MALKRSGVRIPPAPPQIHTVIADLIRNPEVKGVRGNNKTTNQSPSPLMGEESKVRVKTMQRIVTSLRT